MKKVSLINVFALFLFCCCEVVCGQNKSNCGCDYFPLCKVDGTRTFKDGVWKAIDYGVNDLVDYTYYRCDNGVLKSKKELISNWDGDTWGFETIIELKYNEPEGAHWEQTTDMKGNKFYYEHTIVAKNIRFTTPDGKSYDNVIKVYRKKSGASIFYQGQPVSVIPLSSENIYYAKGVGQVFKENAAPPKVKTEREKEIERMTAEQNQREAQMKKDIEEAPQKAINKSRESLASLKGNIDQSITGYWKSVIKDNNNNVLSSAYVRFNSDGTLDEFPVQYNVDRLDTTGYWRFVYRLSGTELQKVLDYSSQVKKKNFTPDEKNFEVKNATLVKSVDKELQKTVLTINERRYVSVDISNDKETGKSNVSIGKVRQAWQGVYKLTAGGNRQSAGADEFLVIRSFTNYPVAFHVAKYEGGKDCTDVQPICYGSIIAKGNAEKPSLQITNCSGKTIDVDPRSVPQNTIILGDREYQYVGVKYMYFKSSDGKGSVQEP